MSMFDTVAWHEQFVTPGGFVFMRRGTGETGWWHDHKDGKDYGGNPMDYRTPMSVFVCRTCGCTLDEAEAWKARERYSTAQALPTQNKPPKTANR